MSHLASGGQSTGISASASVLPMNIQDWMDWLDLLALQWTLKSLLQHHSSKASFIQHFQFYSGENLVRPNDQWGASLVAQTVKNPPAMQETRVQFLSWKDPLEKGAATHSSILAWRIPMDRGAWWATVHGVAKSGTQVSG